LLAAEPGISTTVEIIEGKHESNEPWHGIEVILVAGPGGANAPRGRIGPVRSGRGDLIEQLQPHRIRVRSVAREQKVEGAGHYRAAIVAGSGPLNIVIIASGAVPAHPIAVPTRMRLAAKGIGIGENPVLIDGLKADAINPIDIVGHALAPNVQ